MGEENRSLLEEEIRTEIKRLSTLDSGTQEHTTAVDSLTKLYKLKLEEDKTPLSTWRKSKIVKAIKISNMRKWTKLSEIDMSELV